jgi:putative transposase
LIVILRQAQDEGVKNAEPFGKLRRGARIDPRGFNAGNPSVNSGDQRQEAPYSCRHGGAASAWHRHVRQRSGSRRRHHAVVDLFGMFPFLAKLFADSAYEGPIFHTALALILPTLTTEIVKRSDQAKGFVVLPKRWIVDGSTSSP